MRTGGRLLGLVCAALPAACGLPSGDYFGRVDDHPDPTVLRFCNSGEPQYVDPALSNSTSDTKVVYALWDGLTRHDLQGLPEPSVATHWDIAPDQRRFTFHLRHDARWSTGRPLTSHDFVYQITRVLHPLTASVLAETHWRLRNGKQYSANTVRLMLRDSGPFHAGDVVELAELPAGDDLPADQRKAAEDENARRKQVLSYTNRFRSTGPLELRDLPGSPATLGDQPYYTVDPGGEVTVVEKATAADGTPWAYVHRAWDDGVYGWVPLARLDVPEHAADTVPVRAVPRTRVPGLDLTAAEFAAARDERRPEAEVAVADMMMLPEVLGLRAPDDWTVVLETENPIPYLIDMSPQRAFRPSPREAVSRWPQKWSRPEHIITSGPFHLTEWVVRDHFTMIKSPTYWDAANVELDTLIMYSMDDQAASANYYYYGGCDAVAANNIPASYLPILRGERDHPPYKDYHPAPYLGIYHYLVNTQKYPNRHFRRALAYAIDRVPIPTFLHGGQIPSSQIMPGVPVDRLSDADFPVCGVARIAAPAGADPTCPAWCEETATHDPFCCERRMAVPMIAGQLCYLPPPGLDFDPDKARAELAAARKELGDPSYPGKFTLKFNSGAEGHKLIAEYIQAQWKKVLGLDVDLEVQEWKTFLSDTSHGEYQVARMGSILNFPDAEAEMLASYRCGAPDNRPQWCNQEFEALIAKAEATFDRKQRLVYVREAERVMVEDAPLISLYVYTQHHLQKPYVRDLAMNLTDQVPFEKAWIDPDWKAHLGAAGAR